MYLINPGQVFGQLLTTITILVNLEITDIFKIIRIGLILFSDEGKRT